MYYLLHSLLNNPIFQSKDCQMTHWQTHKPDCKIHKAESLAVAQISGIASALLDIRAWMAYYDTPLKNCAIASMRLGENPHMERNAILYVQLRHTRDPTLPLHGRFTVFSIRRPDLGVLPPGSSLKSTDGYEESRQRGRLEMGSEFYGVVLVAVCVCIGPGNVVISEKR
jgi:hypothetical protein